MAAMAILPRAFRGALTGSTSKPAIVRALGPTLRNYFGVQGVLDDPMIEIYDSNGTLIDSNDDWEDDGYAWQVQALGFAPTDQYESAIYRPSVLPGSYTVIVRGYNNTTGIALVEIYDLEP